MAVFGPLVSTDWLADHLGDSDVKIIDGSWRMPGDGDAINQYRTAHIDGALFFDIDAISDQQSSLPHMLPPQSLFEQAVGAMGVADTDKIVIYDEKGIFSSARVWWTFRAMGHPLAAVLDGGLPKWIAEKRPVTPALLSIAPASYRAAPNSRWRRDADDVRGALADPRCAVIDARPAPRFAGAVSEPRAGLRRGHMPGAVNLPFGDMINENGTLRAPNEIKQIISAVGVDLSQPIITSCGSGVTAAIATLALEAIGCKDHALYDGSWAEWGDEENDDAAFPVETTSGQPD